MEPKSKKILQFEIIKNWEKNKNKTIVNLSKELNVTRKTALNLYRKYLNNIFFNHGNSGIKSHKEIPHELKHEIRDLYIKNLMDFYNGNKDVNVNFKWFYENKIKGKYKISRISVHNLLIEHLFYSPHANKNTIIKINEELNEKIKNDDDNKKEEYKERQKIMSNIIRKDIQDK